MKNFLAIFCFSILLISCKSVPDRKTVSRGVVSENAMVVSARQEASLIGLEMLKKGGNAFDAMIATELSLAVAYPFAGNLGGGGFMVYRTNKGEIGALDYREKAPLAASKNMFLDKNGYVIPDKSTLGAMSVGVPGTVAGMFAVHEKFGTLPIQDILLPIIDLAKKGIVVTKKQENRLKKYQPLFNKTNKDLIQFEHHWKTNDTIKYFVLAETLSRIMQNGKSEFYQGETAKKLVSFIQNNGGIITEEDLKKYKAKWRKPIKFKYDDLTVISMSPPSSGGICLSQIMKMIEPFDLGDYGHNSVKSIQVITEAERRAYADRSYYLGDPDFVSVATAELISRTYVED